MSTENADFDKLLEKLSEVKDIHSAIAVLDWDQMTHIPPEGNAARARQVSTLVKIAHEKFSDVSVGKLLDKLSKFQVEKGHDSFEGALLRYIRRRYERSIKIPPEFTARFSDHAAKVYNTWTKSRPKNDFAVIKPLLEKTLELSREQSSFFPEAAHIADPLIDDSDTGMKAETIKTLFAELKGELVPLIQAISKKPEINDSCIKQFFPKEEQLAFGKNIIKDLGYDFSRGRQDLTHHPFMIAFALDDVRITTRVKENDFSECLFSTIHEAGHAMYEQGVDRKLDGTHLCDGTSSGIHESQSRLWENLVGKSEGFWNHYYPLLQKSFPTQFKNVSQTEFYRAINKVTPSLIRTDADEVTYNLHVMIRFGLEIDLLEGNLSIENLPKAWNDRYEESLGVRPDEDRNGVLQDVHWYSGSIGGSFQGYTIGNIFSAQSYYSALKVHPQIKEEISDGNFSTLRDWLTENIYRCGAKYTPDEVIQKATGQPLTIRPYMSYLNDKFGKIYEL